MSDRPFHRRGTQAEEIVAADGCRLRELLHPDRGGPALPYSLAEAWIEAGGETFPHRLTEEDELYYFLAGRGVMTVDDRGFEVSAGDVVLVPRGAVQSVRNEGDKPLRWLNLVSPPWRADHDVRA